MAVEVKRNHRRRKRNDWILIVTLLCILIGLLGIYHIARMSEVKDFADMSKQPFWSRWFGWGKVEAIEEQAFQVGDQVSLTDSSQYEDAQSYIGQVQAVLLSREGKWHYTVQWTEDLEITEIPQQDLAKETTQYAWGDEIELFQVEGVEGIGTISSMVKVDGQVTYNADFGDLGEITQIYDDEIYGTYAVELKADNDASTNNQLIKDAFTYASQNPRTRLDFPEGNFKVGMPNPTEDYFQLPSDTKIQGNGTTLEIESGMIWFAFATGTAATDGVSNFTMEGMIFQAADLKNGAWFMTMANHGYNWLIRNNEFNLVHKSDSHIFDFGGLQNAVVTNNIFRGYGPDLTSQIAKNSDVAKYDNHHLLYSEVIQLDHSNDTGGWDGNMLKTIDPNYMVNNSFTYLSQYITITNNQFLPYTDSKGKVVAYSGTVGQHSSDVGVVTIADNTFTNPLVNHLTGDKSQFYFDVIHVPENNQASISNNIIN